MNTIFEELMDFLNSKLLYHKGKIYAAANYSKLSFVVVHQD